MSWSSVATSGPGTLRHYEEPEDGNATSIKQVMMRPKVVGRASRLKDPGAPKRYMEQIHLLTRNTHPVLRRK